MKLHLPLSLRSAIYAVFAALVGNVPAQAGIMHSDATLITYTDFGQNEGRYSVGVTNALLQHIRQQEGGVTITYTGGQATYVMPHGMIDFGSNYHDAAFAAISPSAVGTCAHNYTSDYRWTSYFTGHVYGIGDSNAVKYKGIELGEGVSDSRWNSNVFSHALSTSVGNATDHRVMRLSKVITDAPSAEIYDTTGKNLSQLTYYHAGSGQQWRATYRTNTLVNKTNPNDATQLAAGYNYVIGGIVSGATKYAGSTGYYSLDYFDAGGINASDPLTWVSRPGDSGSPLYVWDEDSGTYQYIGSNRGEILSGQVGSAFVIDTAFDKQVVEERYTKQVNMGAVSEVYLNAVSTQGETVTDDKGNSTTKWLGTVTGEGMEPVSFVGLKSELNTWSDLSGLKDTQAWYAYDESYVAQSSEDLFFTENLVFNATAKENRIVLNDTVDLGIGYAEFNGGKFTISSAAGESNLFNHAGYVINAGAEVHLQLTNPSAYMREWRKIGAGDLYIEGSGNNDILLNLGGSGKTYLNRTDGYAAYNVLVNTGATVVISDTEQIKRDLTFGNRGGTLDMNGNSMDWYTTAEEADSTRAGFTINALTEDALVANYSGSSTLTYKEAGDTTYAGSFADSADSSLKIVYDVAEGSWTLNSIRTNLQHEDSGLQVDAGRVILSGTNTVHGTGSATGRDTARYFHEDDWHYADAKMEVRVTDGGTFELGSHARLTGDVTVESGGTYVMREGVRHTMEYVEGGQVLEDTGKYAAYFGHKGDVALNGGTFAVQFNDGVDATTAYNGTVKGTGAMTVDAGGDGGIFSFGGEVDATVSKTLNRGQLQLTGAAAADTTNKWLVNAGGVMVQFENAADTLGVIHTDSSGVIGLTGDTSTQLDLSSHSQLGIGALSGTTVQYGVAGTSDKLTTLNLGGGGKLVVNYALSGTDTLNVNAGGMSGGEINLQNVASDYSGIVNVQAEVGSVSLTTATEGALNNATVNVNDGGIYRLTDEQHALGGVVNVNTGGLLHGKDMVLSSGVVALAGSMKYVSFTVQNAGALNLQSGGRLDATNAATISGSGTMNLNGNTLADKVHLENGGTMYGGGGTIATEASVLAAEGTGKLNAGGGTFNVNGQIGAAKDAILRLENGTFNVNHGNLNSAGGTLELACSTVNLSYLVNNSTQSIGGTLSIDSDLQLNVRQGNPNVYQGISHNINHLHINDGHKLSIVESLDDWRHVFNVSSLTGKGTILWQIDNRWFTHTAMGPSRLILTGDNSFEGALTVNHLDNHGSMQHVSLAHENAAKNMVINLWGDTDSRPGLAISTDTARVAGIGGTVNTFVYAGAVKTAGNGDNPSSSALNTLIINTGNANHTYNGTLLGDSSYGLNIVKDGSGTQTFTSGDNVVHDVTALQGHLNFTNAPTIYGDVSIAQGAQLTVGGDNLELADGRILHVLAGAAGQSASLTNALTITGGEMRFGAFDLAAPSLNLGGVQAGAGFSRLDISFTNRNSIEMGTTYTLASGDWSAFAGKLNQSERGYLNAVLNAGTTGLTASFSLKDGYVYWTGDESVLTPSAKVVFSGKENVYTAGISTPAVVDTGVFDNSGDFTIGSANGSSLAFTTLEKYGSGALVVDTGVSADTAYMMENASLKGSGELSVTTLQLASGTRTEVQGLKLSVSNAIGGEGMLSMGAGSTLQVDDTTTGSASLLDGSALTSSGSTVALGLTLGEAGKASRVKLGVGSGGLSLTGALSVQGDTTLVAEGSGALSFNSAFNNLKALELKTGVSLNQTTALTTHLVLDGGTATASGKQNLQGDITVNAGSTLQFVNDNDVLDYSKNKAIKVNGGTLDFGSTRQTLANWGLELADGAVVSGDGSTYSYNNANRQAALDISAQDTTIKVTSGNNTISARTRLRYGNNLIYDVAQGATLDVSGQVHADEAASKGRITKSGAGTLILSNGTNSYADTTTVNGGILQVSTAGALGSSALVINDGAEARIGASRTLKGDTTVNAGGRLTFTSTETIEQGTWGLYSRNLTVDGGTLDFGGTSQTMAKWNLTLKNGATVAGTGGAYDGSAYTAALDFSQDSTVKAEGVGNIISANVRLRGGNERTLTYQVAEGADLEVSGRMHADTTGALGKVTKSGSGKLVLSSQTRLNMLNTEAGEVVLAYNGADGNILEGLDGAMTGGTTALGVLRLAEKVKLTVTNIWSRAVTGIYLENGAEMTLSGHDLVVTGTGMETARFGVIESDGKKYAKDSIDYELRNGHMKSTADADTSVANRLTYASVENAGSGKLAVTNSANTLTGVVASGGDVSLQNLAAAVSLDVLEVAAGKTVGVYTGAEAGNTQAVTVRDSLILEAGAGLNMVSLTLAEGATLEMTGLEAGAVNLSGALTFGTGLKMGESLLASVGALDYGETLNLFTGLSGVNLPVVVDTESSRVLASSVFSNVQSNTLYVDYRVIDNVGTLLVANVPEPATATLSLMALAALAARRRRKV